MNNFDQSSTGVNIEFNCHYDTHLAQHEFDENFVSLGYNTWLYIDCGNVDKDNYNVSKTVSITGNCQGEFATVVIPTNLGFKKGFDFRSYFENLFYNAPIYARLTVDDNDEFFDFCEYIKDVYTYDKSEFLTVAKAEIKHDKKDIIMKFLENNLSDDLEYL